MLGRTNKSKRSFYYTLPDVVVCGEDGCEKTNNERKQCDISRDVITDVIDEVCP
jgi:hypothetical protein